MKITSHLALGAAMAMAISLSAEAAPYHLTGLGDGSLQMAVTHDDLFTGTAGPLVRVADRRGERRARRDRHRGPVIKAPIRKSRKSQRPRARHRPPAHRYGYRDEHYPLYFMLRTLPYLIFHSYYDAPHRGYRYYSGPSRPILSHRSVRRILRDYRFRHIEQIRRRDGFYIARARNHRGDLVRIRIDAYSGEILRVRFIG
jgi:hypothetical protein